MDKLNADGWLDLPTYKAVFVDHIAADVKFCFQNQRWIGGAQLLMSAIDITAGIERPAAKLDTDRADFIAWADKYLCLSGPEYSLTGLDVYAARCGLLHGYTTNAKLVRKGKAVSLGWVDRMDPPVRANEDKSLVIGSLSALFKAYLSGVADSLKRINGDEALAALVNERLQHMFQAENLDEETKAKLKV